MTGTELKEIFFQGKFENKAFKGKLFKCFAIVLSAIIFILAMDIFDGNTRNETKSIPPDINEYNREEYIINLEKRLSDALGKINGAGEISVFITIENDGEKILASDKKKMLDIKDEEEIRESKSEEEESIVTDAVGSKDEPYITKNILPEPSGILVVAQGAKNEIVKNEIYEAVKAIFGLPAHRIKITY